MDISYLSDLDRAAPSTFRGICDILQQAVLAHACRVLLALHFLHSRTPPRSTLADTHTRRPHPQVHGDLVDVGALTLLQEGRLDTPVTHVTVTRGASPAAPTAAMGLPATAYTFHSIADVKACLRGAPRYALLTAAHLLQCRGHDAYMRCTWHDGRLAAAVRPLLGDTGGEPPALGSAFRAEALVLLVEWLLADRGEDEALVQRALCVSEAAEGPATAVETLSAVKLQGGSTVPIVAVAEVLYDVFPELTHPVGTCVSSVDCGCPHPWLREDLPRWLLDAARLQQATAWRAGTVLRHTFQRWCARRGFRIMAALAAVGAGSSAVACDDGTEAHPAWCSNGSHKEGGNLMVGAAGAREHSEHKENGERGEHSACVDDGVHGRSAAPQRRSPARLTSPPTADRATACPSEETGSTTGEDSEAASEHGGARARAGAITTRRGEEQCRIPDPDIGRVASGSGIDDSSSNSRGSPGLAPPAPQASHDASSNDGEDGGGSVASAIGSIPSLPSESAAACDGPALVPAQTCGQEEEIGEAAGGPPAPAVALSLHEVLAGSMTKVSGSSAHQGDRPTTPAREHVFGDAHEDADALHGLLAGALAKRRRAQLARAFFTWRDGRYYTALATAYLRALRAEAAGRACLRRWAARAHHRAVARRAQWQNNLCGGLVAAKASQTISDVLQRWRAATAVRIFARRTAGARTFYRWRRALALRQFEQCRGSPASRRRAPTSVWSDDRGEEDEGSTSEANRVPAVEHILHLLPGDTEVVGFCFSRWWARLQTRWADRLRTAQLQRVGLRALAGAAARRTEGRIVTAQALAFRQRSLLRLWRRATRLMGALRQFQHGHVAVPTALVALRRWRARALRRRAQRHAEETVVLGRAGRALAACFECWHRRQTHAVALRRRGTAAARNLLHRLWSHWQGRYALRTLRHVDRAEAADAVYCRFLTRRCLGQWRRAHNAAQAQARDAAEAQAQATAAAHERLRLTARVFYRWRAAQHVRGASGIVVRRGLPAAAVRVEATTLGRQPTPSPSDPSSLPQQQSHRQRARPLGGEGVHDRARREEAAPSGSPATLGTITRPPAAVGVLRAERDLLRFQSRPLAAVVAVRQPPVSVHAVLPGFVGHRAGVVGPTGEIREEVVHRTGVGLTRWSAPWQGPVPLTTPMPLAASGPRAELCAANTSPLTASPPQRRYEERVTEEQHAEAASLLPVSAALTGLADGKDSTPPSIQAESLAMGDHLPLGSPPQPHPCTPTQQQQQQPHSPPRAQRRVTAGRAGTPPVMSPTSPARGGLRPAGLNVSYEVEGSGQGAAASPVSSGKARKDLRRIWR